MHNIPYSKIDQYKKTLSFIELNLAFTSETKPLVCRGQYKTFSDLNPQHSIKVPLYDMHMSRPCIKELAGG